MKLILKYLILLWVLTGCDILLANNDWAQFGKYQLQNDSIKQLPLKERPKVIFMGNSITEGWVKEDPDFFSNNNFLGRGISGQTTHQMLNRFREDVINLKPELVIITAGTNDIAENNHVYNEDITLGNIISMAELAKVNNIEVVLTSVLPTDRLYWNPKISNVPDKIISLNERIKDYAESHSLAYVDYFYSMHDSNNAMQSELSKDGVHPTLKGYKMMEEVILPVLFSSLSETSRNLIPLRDDESPQTSNGQQEDAEAQENPH